MSGDIKETAEKKLKSRIRKFKKVLKDENEKEKFFDQLAAQVTISLPTKNPEKQEDMIIFYTNAEGKIVAADYSYYEREEDLSIPLTGKDLDVLLEVFQSNFQLK